MSKEFISPDNRLPATVAAQLQQDLFAHPSAGPIPVAASTVELAIQELRRLQTACDKHSESDLLLEGRAHMSPALREKLEEIAEALDDALGDTDATHLETDEEIREEYPVQWACSEINKLLQSSATSPDGTTPEECIRFLVHQWREFGPEHFASSIESIAARFCIAPGNMK